MSFSAGTVNPKDAKNLGEFNKHLSDKSYVNGFQPSQEDNVAFKSFQEPPTFKNTYVARWYKHIASFDEKERSAWPKQSTSSASSSAGPAADKKDEDFDLFDSDSEDDEEKERVKQERLKAYADKKSKKPGPIAKSNVIYDVKPWDDTITPKQIEDEVRKIEKEGLIWGPGKSVPVAYGVNKLQIACVVVDDLVSTDWLEEQITNIEDLVQSVDVVAFNKV